LLLQRGQTHLTLENWDQAIADYRKILELEPKNAAAISDLAAVLVHRGDEAGYRQLTEQVLERFAHDASSTDRMSVALAALIRPEWLPDATRVQSMLEEAIEGAAGSNSSTRMQEITLARGRLHVLRGQPDEAIRVLQPIVDEAKAGALRGRAEFVVSACTSIAIAQLSKGNSEAADAALTQARAALAEGGWSRSSTRPHAEFAAKVILERAEQVLRDAGAKGAAP
jgi:tetratricopeptide (TPR) repeat protein